MKEIYRDIAWKIMNLRQGKGLTQAQLGLKIGLSKYQISRVERGLGVLTLENLNTLSEYFGIALEDLFRKAQRTEIEMKVRSEYVQSPSKESASPRLPLPIRNYARAFANTARIRSLVIHPKTIRKMNIESNLLYEIYVLEGRLIARTRDDSLEISKNQILSINGSGLRIRSSKDSGTGIETHFETVQLVNIHSQSATVLCFAY